MQRDPQKLTEAQIRRVIGKICLYLIAFPAVDYLIFLASDGNRDVLGMEHWDLLIALALLLIAVVVMKPIYRLEWPFQYQLEQRRKAQKL
jgi:hypothetical protein